MVRIIANMMRTIEPIIIISLEVDSPSILTYPEIIKFKNTPNTARIASTINIVIMKMNLSTLFNSLLNS